MPEYNVWSDSYLTDNTWGSLNSAEQANLLGNTSYSLNTKKGGAPLVPMQVTAITDNLTFSSNQGLKQLEKDRTGEAVSLSGSVFSPIGTPRGKFKFWPTVKMLFWTSLPDPLADLRVAWDAGDYRRLPSGIITFIANGSLFLTHFAAQTVQLALDVLASPTMLVGLALHRARNRQSTLPVRAGYGFLALVAAVVTLPCQIAAVIANTIRYSRHVVDGVVTFIRSIINTAFDLIAHPTQWRDTLGKYGSLMAHSIREVTRNAWNLVPIVITLALAFYTGGLAVLANNILIAAGAKPAAFAILSKLSLNPLILNATKTVGAAFLQAVFQLTLLSVFTQAVANVRIQFEGLVSVLNKNYQFDKNKRNEVKAQIKTDLADDQDYSVKKMQGLSKSNIQGNSVSNDNVLVDHDSFEIKEDYKPKVETEQLDPKSQLKKIINDGTPPVDDKKNNVSI